MSNTRSRLHALERRSTGPCPQCAGDTAQMMLDVGQPLPPPCPVCGRPGRYTLVAEVLISTPEEEAAFEAAMKSGALDDVLVLDGNRWRMAGD